MLERLLERISLSPFRDKFILKGGMLVAAMVGIDTRSTMDMDATIKGIPFSEVALEEAMKVILACPVDDGVKMTLKGFENKTIGVFLCDRMACSSVGPLCFAQSLQGFSAGGLCL